MEKSHTESVLLNLAQSGDADAFCDLASRFDARLFQQAVGLTRDPGLAADLASETMVEAWRSISRFNGSSRFSTWLFSILIHRYHKYIRRNRSTIELHQDIANESDKNPEWMDSQPNPLEYTLHHEKCQCMNECLALLSIEHKEVVLLRFFQDASLAEIAAVQGCSEGTVKSRLHYALEKLRRMKNMQNLLAMKD
jgi:RNA polymerase sigma-70 factor (ECF subfamily)